MLVAIFKLYMHNFKGLNVTIFMWMSVSSLYLKKTSEFSCFIHPLHCYVSLCSCVASRIGLELVTSVWKTPGKWLVSCDYTFLNLTGHISNYEPFIHLVPCLLSRLFQMMLFLIGCRSHFKINLGLRSMRIFQNKYAAEKFRKLVERINKIKNKN